MKHGKRYRKAVEEIGARRMVGDLEAAMRTVAGSARSMGILVEGM